MQRPHAPQFGGLPEQPEGAKCEDHALHDVVLDRHAKAFVAAPAPGNTGCKYERPRDNEQHDRGCEKTEDRPLRVTGAAELREQQRNEK